MKTRIYDNHSHSGFSPDGRMTLDVLVSSAAGAGLAGISVTDHYDIDCPGGTKAFSFDPAEQQAAIDALRKEYSGRLEIFKGIEVGMQPQAMEAAGRLVSSWDFDIVVASVHFIDGLDPYYGEYYLDRSRDEAYGRYFETMYECMKLCPDFDVLGHFDYIARYAPYKDYNVRYRDFPDHFDEILKFLAYNGKALEVNSNTYRLRDGRCPELDLDVLRRYRELGGETVSLGSDAHDSFRVGENLEKYAALVRSAGIRYACRFRRRKMECEAIV